MARQLSIQLVGDRPPPTGANFFRITRVNDGVQLTLAYVDLLDVVDSEAGDTEMLPAQVVGRFALSIEGFWQLVKDVNEIAEKIRAKGGGPE